MSLLSRIADRLILCPSTDPIESEKGRRELVVDSDELEVEAYVSRAFAYDENEQPNLIALKFPGTGGRAERAGVHPCELMLESETGTSDSNGDNRLGDFPIHQSPFQRAEVWTLNHRGYGQSTGPATLQNFVETIDAFWSFIQARYPDATKIVTGNSLGCISALYLAANQPSVSGAMLRNPPPLAELISTRPRYAAWNLGMSRWIAHQVPQELSATRNASMTRCPVLMVTSEKDRVVPASYQQQIIDALAGDYQQFTIAGADHHHPVPEHQEADYVAAVREFTVKVANHS